MKIQVQHLVDDLAEEGFAKHTAFHTIYQKNSNKNETDLPCRHDLESLRTVSIGYIIMGSVPVMQHFASQFPCYRDIIVINIVLDLVWAREQFLKEQLFLAWWRGNNFSRLA